MCEASWSHGNRPFALANATPPSTNLSFQISRKTTLSARKHWAKHPPRSKHRPDLCKMKDCIDREHSLFVLKFSIMRRHLYSLVAQTTTSQGATPAASLKIFAIADVMHCECDLLWLVSCYIIWTYLHYFILVSRLLWWIRNTKLEAACAGRFPLHGGQESWEFPHSAA